MRATRLAAAVRVVLLAGPMVSVLAQPALGQQTAAPPEEAGVLEEVTVTGRQQSAATQVLQERIDEPVLVDIVAAEQIARVGDSTVSTALRRLPGVSLVGDQFIYVRGLGERYSSTTLNGAYVPSPDLTRNVIPLDLFPAEIIDSLSVNKGYSVNQRAAFGGGNVDIRTLAVPDDAVLRFQVGTGWDTRSSDDVLTYRGGARDWIGTDDGTRAMSGTLSEALQTYRGNLSVNNIHLTLLQDGQHNTLAEAQEINRALATSLNRDVQIRSRSADPDLSVEAAAGNSWYLGGNDDLRFGVLGLVDYKNGWRNRERIARDAGEPDTLYAETLRSTNQISVTGSLNLGVNYTQDHTFKVTGLYLRNTDDETSITSGFNTNIQRSSGDRYRTYGIRFEERELDLWLLGGRHALGEDTLAMLGPWLNLDFARDLAFSWYYSDAVAKADIPNEVTVLGRDRIDPASGELISTGISAVPGAAEFRFTDLRDDVQSYGWALEKPFTFGELAIKLSGGWDYQTKGRSYRQTQFSLGTTASGAPLTGGPGDVFTDPHIVDPANGFVLGVGGGTGRESYLAGETLDAYFGQLDLRWADTWRLNAGWRREYFQRVSVPINTLNFGLGAQGIITLPPEQLPALATTEEGDYPAAALTYMRPGFWAERFQLRLGWSRTTARPDLREVSDAYYIDPFTEARVRGEPSLVSAGLTNYDLRAEWFFASGDNFTVSLFYKDIADPIETVQRSGTDDDIVLGFVNGESAEIYGMEVEWLKRLGFLSERLGAWTDSFFVAGNLMYADSQITVGRSSLGLTNNKHPLSQASDWVANLQLGFDSADDKHAASLVFNGTGKRLFFAGRNGAADAYEEPFTSLDLVYSYYPADSLSLRLRAQNLLGDSIDIKRGDVVTLTQKLGRTFRLDATLRF